MLLTNTTATQILLPIGQRYLLNEAYMDQTELVDSCISFVTAVCLRLSMSQYLKLLDGMVKKKCSSKRFERQRVEVISRILQNFSYAPGEEEEKHTKKMSALLSSLLRQIREDKENNSNLPVLVSVAKLSACLGTEENHVQSILLELATRLKGKFHEDRQLAGKVLLEVMVIVGPRFLPLLLSNLESSLQRGYQVHILIHTLAHILQGISEQMNSDVASAIADRVVHYVTMELFSDFSKEKTVSKILSKTPEAKKISSFQILRLLSSLSDEETLTKLLAPFIDSPNVKRSFETASRARRAMASINAGLEQVSETNDSFVPGKKLLLAYGILHQKLELNTAPACVGFQHEFGLGLLLSVVRNHLSADGESNSSSISVADVKPFMSFLLEAVKSDNVEVSALALRVTSFLCKQKWAAKELFPSDVCSALVPLVNLNLKRHQRSQDSRCFTFSCSLADALLGLSLEAWRKDDLALVKSICLAAVDRHPVKCLKVLANFLDMPGEVGKEEGAKLVVMFCKIFLENSQQKTLDMIKFILLRESRRTHIPVEFMLQNFSYKGDIGESSIEILFPFYLLMCGNLNCSPRIYVH